MSQTTIGGSLFDPAVNEMVRNVLPDPLISTLEVATHLGDPATVITVATVFFWATVFDRTRDPANGIACLLALGPYATSSRGALSGSNGCSSGLLEKCGIRGDRLICSGR